jgi:NAD+ synthase (glutamine-hydrolysing)
VPQLRVALAQVDATVGDLSGNADLIRTQVRDAAERGAHLVVLPELALTGYPPEDLTLRASFVDASRTGLDRLATRLGDEGLGEIAVVVGYLDRCPDPAPRVGRPAGEPQNAAALLHGGAAVARYAKHHLPNYGVFDEFRYFVPGDVLPVIRLHGIDVALTICEDIWQEGGPIGVARQAGVGLVVCINASPYERHKEDTRRELVPPSPTSTWWADRTNWSSTVTPWWSGRTASCSAAPRSSARSCWWSTWTYPRRAPRRPVPSTPGTAPG